MLRRKKFLPEVGVEESYFRDFEGDAVGKVEEGDEIGIRTRILFILGKELAERLENEGKLDQLIKSALERDLPDGEIVSLARKMLEKDRNDPISELISLNPKIDEETTKRIYGDYMERLKKIFSLELSKENTEILVKEIVKRIDFVVEKLLEKRAKFGDRKS